MKTYNVNNGLAQIEASEDSNINEIMDIIASKFKFLLARYYSKADSFIKATDGGYEVKVWNLYGRSWNDKEFKFGELIYTNNNTDKTILFTKKAGKWHATFKERRYYGLPDIETKLF